MSPSPPSSPSSTSPSNENPNPNPNSSSLAVSIAVATSSSDLLTPLAALPAPNAPPTSSSSARRIPPPCWTNDETLALIDSYKEKWYSLNRGNLRATHWDEVAAAVSARSRHTPGSTPKTPVQCRHKVEKLRKRYRSEKQRSLSHDPRAPPSSPWIFFPHIHSMEHQPPPLADDPSDDDDIDDDHDQFLLRPPPSAQPNGGIGGLKFKIPKAVRSRAVGSATTAIPRAVPSPNPSLEMRRRVEERRSKDSTAGDDSSSSMGEVVRALRALGDGYVRTEQMKMEMAREMERARMDAELRRTEMVLDAQRRIVDAVIGELVIGKKKRKKAKIAAAAATATADS